MDPRVFVAGNEAKYNYPHNIGAFGRKTIAAAVKTAFLSAVIVVFSFSAVSLAHAESKRVVVLGDSLTAGYGLEGGEAFPEQLQIALNADGVDVAVENAGVSGDTSAGGLARLEWAVSGDKSPDLVVVALGGNDMLRGLDVAMTRKNLAGILSMLKDKKIPALFVGMKAQTQYSAEFQSGFDKIYPELAHEYDVAFYPFFLEGVALDPALNQNDGIHPNQKGVAEMVKRLAPVTKALLE